LAYNLELEKKLAPHIVKWGDLVGKKMFGGIGYLRNGNMAFGIYQDSLILRLAEDKSTIALQRSDMKPFDITGRPMKGWVMMTADGWQDGKVLRQWIELAYAFAGSLPAKK
jgi:TfoX/Sxy family transcriptional regulator of competence genes